MFIRTEMDIGSMMGTATGIDECGWLKDKYGASWQVVPRALIDMLNDPDREKSQRVMTSMLKMKKIEIDELRRSYAG
jgi:predicted 3-demethylubiquinone-9 3-methyltransferase (glyoxalase superfamily)